MSDTDNTQPVRLGGSKPEVARVPLFYINDVEYTMPAEVKPTVGLKYMRDLQRGVDVQIANANLLEGVLGTETYNALVDYEDLTTEDLEAIMKIITDKAFGSSENVSKN